jgi:DNA-binding NarL/FixJ family response regulator
LQALCEGAQSPALTTTCAARATLSPRQLEIATLASKGHPNREIASRLNLSYRTIENKLHDCYQLLGISGRAELQDALGSLDAK